MPEQINIGGNTYTLGATVGPVSGTGGSTSYFYNNLAGGQTYYFVVVAYNYAGFSGYAGPVSVYTPASQEIRTVINSYAWSWPHNPVFYNPPGYSRDVNAPITRYSDTPNNLFYLSNRADITRGWNRSNMNSSNSSVNKFSGIDPPFEGANVIAVNIRETGYYNLFQTVYNLIPGTTYTYSFYHNLDGVTGLAFRIDHATGLTTPIRQIEPIDQGNFSFDESYSTTTLRNLTYPTGSGWRRFVAQFRTNPGQTYGNFSIFGRSYNTSGDLGTGYIAAPQLAAGTAAPEFVSTIVIANWEGICGDDDKLLAFGNSYGLTYMAPTINPFAELQVSTDSINSQLVYFPGYSQNTSVSRTARLLKALPENKRALLPGYLFSDDLWFYYNDSLNFQSGNTFNFPINLYDSISTNQKYPTIWPVEGISYTKELWNPVLSALAATGASIDYLISNAEVYGLYGSFNWTTPGLTAAMSSSSKYRQSYLGLTAWDLWLTSLGATITNVMNGNQDIYTGQAGNLDYIVWDAINRAHELRAMDAIFAGITSIYPNITLADYEWSMVTDGDQFDAPPDLNGNPAFWQYHFGNAAAPQLYGWMGGIVTVMGICGTDPSYLYFAPNTSGAAGPPDWALAEGDTRPQKDAWTSFVMSIQTVRSSKRARPTLPITPWISSVKFRGQDQAYPGNSADRPQVGFVDMNVGYNPQHGITLREAGGNSAYYYEMVRHTMLSGTKALLYWNTPSFEDARVSTGVVAVPEYLIKYASGQGATGFIDDMQKLNDVIGEVNDKIGGFTLTTADSSRISWLAPYIASGAPGLNGTTWWWRITANPRYQVLVDGNTLLSSTGPGMWLGTTGPTLGVDISSSLVLGSMS